jgi:hypothetical protein
MIEAAVRSAGEGTGRALPPVIVIALMTAD